MAVSVVKSCSGMFGTGAIYLDDCPVQRFIPIYLVVGGVFNLWANLASLIHSVYLKKNPEAEPSVFTRFCQMSQSLICCFIVAWFIAGELRTLCVWCGAV